MKNTRNSQNVNSRYEIRLAGTGGQGIILAGIILAEAAILDGRYIVQAQSYGPEARGGNSVSEVIVSNVEIDYPKVLELDILVALSQEACDRNLPDVKAEGLVVIDSGQVNRVLWGRLAALPLQQIARTAGEERAINMAALGAVASFCPDISVRSLLQAIAKRLPSNIVEANCLVFSKALETAQELRKSLKSTETRDEFDI